MSVNAKILLPIILGFIAITSIVHLWWGPALMERERERLIHNNNMSISMLQAPVSHALMSGDLAEVYSLLNEVKNLHGDDVAQVHLVDAKGVRIYPFKEQEPLFGEFYIAMDFPLENYTFPVGLLTVVFDIESDLKTELKSIQRLEIYISSIMGLIALFSAVWFNAYIRRPLLRLQCAATQMANGEFNVNLQPGKSYGDEISVLTDAFLTMRDNLSVAYDDLNSAAQNARDNELRQRTILSNVADGILLVDEKKRIVYVNLSVERLFQLDRDSLIGQQFDLLFAEPLALNLVVRGYEGQTFESMGVRSGAETFPLELSANSVEIDGERVFVVILRDISERKRVDKMKSEFVSTVSHELRTPLTSMRGALSLMKGGVVGVLPPEAQKLVELSSRNAERLLFLVNDILDMQKIESGEMELHSVDVDVSSILRQAAEDCAGYAKQCLVVFDIQDECSARVQADPDRLMQVVVNLLSNAAKFSHEGGVVEIGCRQLNAEVQIYVRDYGSGIDEAFLPRLFDKFTQGDSSDSRHAEGTGLGLAITKVLVEKQCGRIEVETQVGVGSTFYLYFPIMVEKQRALSP